MWLSAELYLDLLLQTMPSQVDEITNRRDTPKTAMEIIKAWLMNWSAFWKNQSQFLRSQIAL